MTDRWTAETEELVARAIFEPGGRVPVDAPERVLTALADAGLLLAPGGETREEWGVIEQIGPRVGSVTCHSRERAEKFLASTLITPVDTRQLASRSRTTWADGSELLGPWVPVDDGGGT
jgi:hypothetical protein